MLTNKTKVTRFLNRTETILWWGLPLKPLEAVAVTTVRKCNTTLSYFETEVSLFICLSNREGRLHRLLSERPFCFGAGRCSWILYRRNLGEEKLVKLHIDSKTKPFLTNSKFRAVLLPTKIWQMRRIRDFCTHMHTWHSCCCAQAKGARGGGWVGTAIYCMDNLGQEQQAPFKC